MSRLFLRSTKIVTPPSSDFSTTFPDAENPISQSGIWINGGTDGGKWQDVQTSIAKAYAAGFAGQAFEGTEFDDPIAILSPSYRVFAANQFARGVVFCAADYAPGTNHEIELHLRGEITANNARSYESLWNRSDGEVAIVRWNGPSADFDQLGTSVFIDPPVEDDVMEFQAEGTLLTVIINDVEVATYDTAEDATKWSDGNPGMGFWPRSNGSAVKASLGWKQFEAGDL